MMNLLYACRRQNKEVVNLTRGVEKALSQTRRVAVKY